MKTENREVVNMLTAIGELSAVTIKKLHEQDVVKNEPTAQPETIEVPSPQPGAESVAANKKLGDILYDASDFIAQLEVKLDTLNWVVTALFEEHAQTQKRLLKELGINRLFASMATRDVEQSSSIALDYVRDAIDILDDFGRYVDEFTNDKPAQVPAVVAV